MSKLFAKYTVYRVRDGQIMDDCFVLRPKNDPAALAAIQRYIEATQDRELADDLSAWIAPILRERDSL
jgi:hypothetical protein